MRSGLIHGLLLIVVLVGATGCTDDSADDGGTGEGHLLEEQQRALERARSVEEDIARSARERQQAAERDEGGG